ncbi:5-formyltetrahydrofolate cyclo-ligase [Elusimicrobiota bacterium]
MKDKLRKKHIGSRRELKTAEKERADLDILDKLKENPDIEGSTHIMVYASTPDEVDTCGLIDFLLDNGKKVYLPVVAGHDIKISRIDTREELVPGKFGIMEPQSEQWEFVDPDILDVVIVPGVCFTEDGIRLGRGGGYYDRFIKQLSRRTKVIGICYDMQIEEDIPCYDHDEKVDKIVTDKGGK